MKQLLTKSSETTIAFAEEPCNSFKRMGEGELFVVDIKRSRNPVFHKAAFAWMQNVFDNQDIWDTFPQMRYQVTIEAGYVECTYEQDGIIIVVPKSLSFESMEQEEFEQWQKDFDLVLLTKHGIDVPFEQ